MKLPLDPGHLDTWRLGCEVPEGVVPVGSKYTKRYSDEYKRDAIELVRSSGRTVTEVARELGISSESLRGWVKKARAAQDNELVQRCVSRVRTALVIDVSLVGWQRALRRMHQILIAAMVLAPGHRRREWARLTHFCLSVRSLPGFRRWGTATMSPAP